jgi:hypothetical protein
MSLGTTRINAAGAARASLGRSDTRPEPGCRWAVLHWPDDSGADVMKAEPLAGRTSARKEGQRMIPAEFFFRHSERAVDIHRGQLGPRGARIPST